jgi:hypothetical protein
VRFVSMSTGQHSVALAIYLHLQGEDFEMVMADTGAELPESYWMAPRIARELDKKLHIVSAGTFWQHLSNQGYLLPSYQRRWCTRVLKQEPLRRFYAARTAQLGMWSKDAIVSVGICADEADRMQPSATMNPGYPYDRPLIEAGIDKAEAHRICERRGLLNPCYQWRSSCSCFCCPMQRKSDWLGLLVHHPELYALSEQWEAESNATTDGGYTWVKNRTLGQLREASAEELAAIEESPEEACAICQW